MNQEIIPLNNLPVYLQRYNIDILDDKEEFVGKVLYTTVGAIPSDKPRKRVWNLNLTGYLKPNVDQYNIVYDFSKVDYKYKEDITFEDIISGTFSICGRLLDASKIIGSNYSYNDEKSTLTIKLDTSKWNFRLKTEVLFTYQLNVNDSARDCCNDSSSEIIFTSEPPTLNATVGLQYEYVVTCECVCSSGGESPIVDILKGDPFPSWLKLDQPFLKNQATLSGTPTQGDVGANEVVVTASSSDKVTTASQTFTITVSQS